MQKNYNPLVSVIIPSYNHAQYIECAIDSIKMQTYENWELIIIDDGSKDNTHEILGQMPSDKRITIVLNKDNQKQSKRLNQAIAISRGEFISILGSDDWFIKEKLEKQVNLFANLSEEYGVVYSSGYRYFEDLNKTVEVNTNSNMRSGDILKELLTEPFFIYPASNLIRKTCLIEYPFDVTYSAEGEAIFFKIAMKYKYAFINEPLVTMREHSYNIGGDIQRMLEENIRYREELFNHKDFPVKLLKYKGKILGKIYKLKGWEYIRLKKDYIKGKQALVNAIKVNKLLLFDFRVIVGLVMVFLPRRILSKINGS